MVRQRSRLVAFARSAAEGGANANGQRQLHDDRRRRGAEVAPKTAYTANAALFEGADFIGSSNLAIDNLVLCRHTLAP